MPILSIYLLLIEEASGIDGRDISYAPEKGENLYLGGYGIGIGYRNLIKYPDINNYAAFPTILDISLNDEVGK